MVAFGYLKHRFRSQKQDPTFLRPDNTNLRIAAAESLTRTRTRYTLLVIPRFLLPYLCF